MGTRTKAALKGLSSLVLLLIIGGGLTFYVEPLWVNDQIIRAKLWHHGVDSHYVQVDGYSMHYLEAAPRRSDGVPLVLIHGIGSRAEDWAPMIPALAEQGFHVYVPDLLGYGRTAKPDVDYRISLEESIILKFMDTQHLQNADIGGWSMGGWIALRLAIDHPERVNRLVVYDAAGIYFPPTFDSSLFLPTDAAGLAHLTHVLSPQVKPQLPAFVVRAAIDNLQQNAWIIQRSFDAMVNGKDLTDFRLEELHKPTLVVWGSLDELIPLSVGEQMHRDIPQSSMAVIDGCGHLAPAECPAQVLKATTDFLKSNP